MTPETLRTNAWTGEAAAAGPLSEGAKRWALRPNADIAPPTLAPTPPAPLEEWADPEIGYGIVLPDVPGMDDDAKARGEDAPEPLRRLIAERPGTVVLRYVGRVTYLRRYYTDRPKQDVVLSGGKRGTAPGSLPRYLLLFGPPTQLPWQLQYVLNGPCMVGRLWLEGDALERYVDRLLTAWAGSAARSSSTVVWAVDHGGDDITTLMRTAIAEPIAASLRDDEDVTSEYVDGAARDATVSALTDALARRAPGLVVTTSHGMTGPLGDVAQMTRDLGLLVDAHHGLAQPDAVLEAWEPDGAIWYSHACCSAGTASVSGYKALVEEGSEVHRVLTALEGAQDTIAPFPTALLSAEKPLRAFVGHVEPTFDWTIRHPGNKEVLTAALKQALYTQLLLGKPIAFALADWHDEVGNLLQQLDAARAGYGSGGPWETAALLQLAARDRQGTVILGDPTVALSSLVP